MRIRQISFVGSLCLSRLSPSFCFCLRRAHIGHSTSMVQTRQSQLSMNTDKRKSPSIKRTKSVSTVTPSPKKSRTTSKSLRLIKKTDASVGTTPVSAPSMTLVSSQVAAVAPDSPYLDLNVPPAELRPSATLTIGQCFHWRVIEPNDNPARSTLPTSAWGTHDSTEWVGIVRISNSNHSDAHSLVVSLQETPDTTLYRVLHAPPLVKTTNNVERILHDYFQLDTPLGPLYQEWSQADSIRLSKIAECIPGVRIVNQDPWECLVSFLCSSNNNIPRITKMLKAIRETYGTPLVTIGEETLYSFPSCEELRNRATEQDLRDIGMGYRAKYLIQTMETLAELGGEAYLHALRETRDANVVQEALMQFSGVGRKVADCVALFSLRQGDAIPIDVHVWNIARRDYDKEGVLVDVKSMTPTIYKQTASLFQSRFKRYAGWAHSLLFVAELPSFRAVLPQNVIDEMEKFREIEQKKKTATREAKRAEKRHLT